MTSEHAPASETVLVLLASGLSQRFHGDKLLADFDGAPLLERAAQLGKSLPFRHRIAVVGADQTGRAKVCAHHDWALITNAIPEQGQGVSLALAAHACLNDPACQHILIALGDMPFVTDAVLGDLLNTVEHDAVAAVCETQGVRSPPAVFRRILFDKIANLSGDDGAKQILRGRSDVAVLSVAEPLLFDVDTESDLDIARRHVEERSES